MIEPPVPADEARRVATLRSLGLLDTPPEERFDRITRLAQRILGVPIVLISLVDDERQWFKSRQGLDVPETTRASSFCAHAINDQHVFLVPDAQLDPRFSDNPLVVGDPNIRFYAGAPIAAPDGSALGTLCVIGREPRELGAEEVGMLEDLAMMVEQEVAISQLALVDEMTGLGNLRSLLLVGRHSLEVCTRKELAARLVFLDLDDLKPLNDTLGHPAGDNALRAVADALLATFRAADVIARTGGDEFCALLVGAEEIDGPLRRLRDSIVERGRARELPDLSVSIGHADFDPAAPRSLEDLIAEADAAMYRDKARHRSTPA